MSNFLKKNYTLIDNIFCCNISDKSTQKVTKFYKETPFPNYKEDDDRASILEKMETQESLGEEIDDAFEDGSSLILRPEYDIDRREEDICSECIFGYNFFARSSVSRYFQCSVLIFVLFFCSYSLIAWFINILSKLSQLWAIRYTVLL